MSREVGTARRGGPVDETVLTRVRSPTHFTKWVHPLVKSPRICGYELKNANQTNHKEFLLVRRENTQAQKAAHLCKSDSHDSCRERRLGSVDARQNNPPNNCAQSKRNKSGQPGRGVGVRLRLSRGLAK